MAIVKLPTSSARPARDRRRHPRTRLRTPAMVQVNVHSSELRAFPGTIENLSLGGVKLTIEKRRLKCVQLEEDVTFEAFFKLAEHDDTVLTLRCNVRRCEPEDDRLKLGAEFVDMDEGTYEYLQRRLAMRQDAAQVLSLN